MDSIAWLHTDALWEAPACSIGHWLSFDEEPGLESCAAAAAAAAAAALLPLLLSALVLLLAALRFKSSRFLFLAAFVTALLGAISIIGARAGVPRGAACSRAHTAVFIRSDSVVGCGLV